MRPLIALMLFALSVTGCGYKTPLVLPKPKPEAQKPSSPPPAAADAKKSGDGAVKE
ncbi:MAG TPA: lipoprotein [Burkholderiales bacterium]|nr:lipoprotein [Burkholderiales bacterium]